MALDWSIRLHAIYVRVELDIKTTAPQKGYLIESTFYKISRDFEFVKGLLCRDVYPNFWALGWVPGATFHCPNNPGG
jgi:hypothetical protein